MTQYAQYADEIGLAPGGGGSCVPDRAAAAALAGDHPVIPVYQEVLADTVTPVQVLAGLREPGEPGFLLESVPVSGGVARYSYIGYRPRLLTLTESDPLAGLRPLTTRPVAPVAGLPPFHGGVIGYLGWEAAGRFERLPQAAQAAPALPESAFLSVDNLVVFDHVTRRLLVMTLYYPGREDYDKAVDRIEEMRARLCSAVVPASFTPRVLPAAASGHHEPDLAGWRSNMTKPEFLAKVRRAREYIAAGDAFQIVLSQRFTKPLHTDPLDLYRQLRSINPSPYMYYLDLGGGRHIVGASPELLVKADGTRVETRPLAGTRRRGADTAADLALERELLADEKERAEHVMLVDLGRNDLGRVAAPGTVQVEEFMKVERFSHVMHLSSTVIGRLATEATCLDALRSTFPAGTLSGAPKIRAMEIIAELEPERRGIYGGALGYIGLGGTADLAIALRTMTVANGQVYVQAGAGVVADSDPEREYQETLHKARAMFNAVHQAEAMT